MKTGKPDKVKTDSLHEQAVENLLKKKGKLIRDIPAPDFQTFVHGHRGYQAGLVMQNEVLRNAQIRLEESRNMYSGLYEFAPVGYFTTDKNGLILEVNLAAAAQLGVERSILRNKKLSGFIAAEDQDIFYLHQHKTFGSSTPQSCEVRLKHNDGSVSIAQLRSSAVKDSSGNISFCLTAVIDISARREIEQMLLESENKYRNLISNALVGIFTSTLKGEIIYLNDAALRMFEFKDLEEAAGSLALTRYKNPQDREVLIGLLTKTGKVDSYEVDLLTKTGKIKNMLLSATFDGDILSGMLMDMTEHKMMEKASASNALLKLFTRSFSRNQYLDSVTDLIRTWSKCRCAGVRILDENGNIPYESYAGFSKEFWEQENWLSIKTDHCVCIRVITESPELHEAPYISPSGSFYCNNSIELLNSLDEDEKKSFRGVCIRNGFLSIAVIPVRYQNKVLGAFHLADEHAGKVPLKCVEFIEGIAPIIGEVIKRFSIEEDRTSLMAAAESVPDAIVITNVSGKIQYANPAFEHITGYSRAETAGNDLHILDNDSNDEAVYQAIREAMKQGRIWNGQLISKKKDGSLFHEECTISPIKDPFGKYSSYVSVRRDITDKLRLESIAEAVNAMNNIGYVFSGIRHEIGNPINSMKMALNLLHLNLNNYSKQTVEEYIKRILEELARVEYLLKSLKTFNMYETPELRSIRVREFLEKFLSLSRNDHEGKGVAIISSVEPDVDSCYADPRALQQVVLNIFTNACDACEGRVDPVISVTASRSRGMICLRISDNGCGMSEEQQNNLFKPFYTTKVDGTGLGLVIAKKMLAKMNSAIEVRSRLNQGTEVDMLIPEGPRGQ